MNLSVGERANAAVMSNNPMFLACFMFLLAATANIVPSTATGGVPAKRSSPSPYATSRATQHHRAGTHHQSVRDGCGYDMFSFSKDTAEVMSVADNVRGDAEHRVMTANTLVRLNSAD